jgi:hypothetical protein
VLKYIGPARIRLLRTGIIHRYTVTLARLVVPKLVREVPDASGFGARHALIFFDFDESAYENINQGRCQKK